MSLLADNLEVKSTAQFLLRKNTSAYKKVGLIKGSISNIIS